MIPAEGRIGRKVDGFIPVIGMILLFLLCHRPQIRFILVIGMIPDLTCSDECFCGFIPVIGMILCFSSFCNLYSCFILVIGMIPRLTKRVNCA